jgi:HAD superfamily hydrolase (TIGR01509 family)
MKNDDILIKAVLFDFDGTLTQPGVLNFPAIKKKVGCPADTPVLEFIQAIPDNRQKSEAYAELDVFETEGAANSVPCEGAEVLVQFLQTMGVPVGIFSRNSYRAIEQALENFKHIGPMDFDLIISRDDTVEPKPHPAGIFLAAERFGVEPANLLMVGDYLFDIEAGNRAGAPTALITFGTSPDFTCQADVIVENMADLKKFIHLHRPLPSGKFPNDLLQDYLDGFTFDDPQLLVKPSVGEDTAALLVDEEEVLILKTDPITFATDAVGHYAVLVNANDIATSGAIPRWLLTTLLFPPRTTPAKILSILDDLRTHCQKWDITLCGGHTEITDAVTRPVVSGMMAGTVSKSNLLDKRNIRTGDQILITKSVAVEGTSLIAREFADRLKDLGMTSSEIATGRTFLDGISILPEARIAGRFPGVSAMHDVTEGGVATAIAELGIAGKHTLEIDLDRIPIYPETRKMCDLLGIDPLGLIGSGSLLICCRKNDYQSLTDRVQQAGINITLIGEVLSPGKGIRATRTGQQADWPEFDADEITKLFGRE